MGALCLRSGDCNALVSRRTEEKSARRSSSPNRGITASRNPPAAGCAPSAVPEPPVRKPQKATVEASPLFFLLPRLRIDELPAEERAVYETSRPERLPQHGGHHQWTAMAAGPVTARSSDPGTQQGGQERSLSWRPPPHRPALAHPLPLFRWRTNSAGPAPRSKLLMPCLKSIWESNLQRMMDNNVRMKSTSARNPRTAPRGSGKDALGRGGHGGATLAHPPP